MSLELKKNRCAYCGDELPKGGLLNKSIVCDEKTRPECAKQWTMFLRDAASRFQASDHSLVKGFSTGEDLIKKWSKIPPPEIVPLQAVDLNDLSLDLPPFIRESIEFLRYMSRPAQMTTMGELNVSDLKLDDD